MKFDGRDGEGIQLPALKDFSKVGPRAAAGLDANAKSIFFAGGHVSDSGMTAWKFRLRRDAAALAFMEENDCKLYQPVNKSQDDVLCRKIGAAFRVFNMRAEALPAEPEKVRLHFDNAFSGEPDMAVFNIDRSASMAQVMQMAREEFVRANRCTPNTPLSLSVQFSSRMKLRTLLRDDEPPAKRQRRGQLNV